MELVLLFKAIIMGLVEGITEFLPISSTGHLIVTGELINFWTPEKRKVFEVVIQLGAILAVLWLYREKVVNVVRGLLANDASAKRFTINVLAGFLPALIIGALAYKSIKAHLFNPLVVASTFIIGGIVIIWLEKRQHTIKVHEMDELSWQDALKVGFAQCLAMIPGTSRSGATIMGGLFFGLDRKVATEFSFFLAIPIMFAATFKDVWENRHGFVAADFPVFAVGFVVSFISALFVIRALLRYISNHDFTAFAWYRIAFGLVILGTWYAGLVNWQ